MIVSNQYDVQVQPVQNDHKKWIWTRASKEVRYSHYEADKRGETTLADKERRSIELIKMALTRSDKPSLSCSFGIDSMVALYLTRKALEELGRDPSDIDIAWGNTLNEFPEVRTYAKRMEKEWNLRLTIATPKRPLKKIIDNNGGITSDYFTARKGDRRNGQPLGEKCCNTLKHEPVNRMRNEKQWDLQINGTRADESRTRFITGLRDGEYYYSSTSWKSMVCKPLLWWNEDDIWEYVEQYKIPFNGLYHNNLIQKYPDTLENIIADNYEKLTAIGLDVESLRDRQTQTVTRKQAIFLEKLKFKLFTPRTGCMMCPIPVKYGYLQWMRIYYPKVYDAMIHNLGYGPALLSLVPDDVKAEIKEFTGIDITEENAHEHLQEILVAKPCTFDSFSKSSSKSKKEAE